MTKPVGRKNRDHDAKRAALALALIPRVLAPDGASASMRSLAQSAGVSVPTLEHYFTDRAGAVAASIAAMGQMGAPHVARSANEPHGLPRESFTWYLREIVGGWRRFGFGRMISASLSAGLGEPRVGPITIDSILEPLLQAAEARIQGHVDRGEMPACDARHAALVLVSPILFALLHQDDLGGSQCRPLDVDAMVDPHVERFLKAFGA